MDETPTRLNQSKTFVPESAEVKSKNVKLYLENFVLMGILQFVEFLSANREFFISKFDDNLSSFGD